MSSLLCGNNRTFRFDHFPFLAQQVHDCADPRGADAQPSKNSLVLIKDDRRIEFGTGVTVIFGENDSGKSGFVRVLTRAAGVRIAEDILPNIRDNVKPTPNATFTYSSGREVGHQDLSTTQRYKHLSPAALAIRLLDQPIPAPKFGDMLETGQLSGHVRAHVLG